MTAHAGDALSHVYFVGLQVCFEVCLAAVFAATFQGEFQRPIHGESTVTILPSAPASGSRASCKLNGSARICMGAMSLRKASNPVPRRLLVATS
ncbi:MAG: hypothetical protein ACREEK_27085 [Bradyrhizobium sp.]